MKRATPAGPDNLDKQKLDELPPKKRWVKKAFARGGAGKEFKIAAFDTETNALDGDVIFGTMMTEDCDVASCVSGSDIVNRMFEHMCGFPDYIWFAHNAQFDWRYFLDVLRSRNHRIEFALRNDNSIFAVRVFIDNELPKEESRQILMRDSYAIWPHTLRKLAQAFCPELPKGDIDFGREAFNPRKRSHVAYAKRDVEILVRGLRRYDDIIFEKYGVHLSGTVASTALRAWERMLDKETRFHNPKSHETFIRSAYFGGLVFLTRSDKLQGLKTYDINSSFPYQMREHGAPYGTILATRFFHNSRPGIYDVTIRAPENLRVPIIPKRDYRGGSPCVLWPRGIFRTCVTSLELEFALQRGYRLFEIHEGRVWDKIIYPFTEFVNRAEQIRASFKGQTEEQVAKLIQNSLYGKFAARRERRTLHAANELNGEIIGYEPWDERGDYYVKREYVEDLLVLPQWSLWITANARLHLLKAVYDTLGVNAVVYGDTDSVTTFGELPTGNGYGEWKLDKSWSKFRAIAPKVYAGQLEDGRWAGAAKGIPSSEAKQEIFKQLYENGKINVEINSLPSLLVTIKTGERRIKSYTRWSTNIENSANWQAEGDRIFPRWAAG